jgi:hypothetical protein
LTIRRRISLVSLIFQTTSGVTVEPLKAVLKVVESPSGAKFNSLTERVGSTLPKPISSERAKQLISPFQGLSGKLTFSYGVAIGY